VDVERRHLKDRPRFDQLHQKDITMLRFRLPALTLIAIVSLVLLFSGCNKNKEVDTIPEPATPPATTEAPVEQPVIKTVEEVTPEYTEPIVDTPITVTALNSQGLLRTIYFEFDKSDLSEVSRSVLRANADMINEHANFTVVIEGHCDDRGTIEYNLALGQRRANAVRDYLSSMGVAANRLRVVSYGEERPDPQFTRSNEQDWAKNRRAEFTFE
jgi:peptidoglycan-associated lipoprotein